MTLRADVKGLLDQLAAMPNQKKLWELSPPEARAAYEAMGALLAGQKVPIGRTEALAAPGPAGEIPIRLYRPVAASMALPVVVFFHGGGFVIGSIESHDDLCRRLANASGCALASVEYRLAPEHPFPAAVEDCWAATRFIETNAAGLSLDANVMMVAGDSAGGNLAAVIAQLAKAGGGPRLAHQLLIYPTTEARAETPSMAANARGYLLEKPTMDWFFGHYVPPGIDAKDPRLSPLLAPDLKGLPPATIYTAEYDPLRDEGRLYAERLAAAGVPVRHIDLPGTIHGFANMAGLWPHAAAAIEEMGRFLAEAARG